MERQSFRLHQKLAADTVSLGRTGLCDILLMNDQTWPWVLLVPRRPDVREIYQLPVPEQQQLLAESSLLGEGMMEAFGGDKLNIGALGNMVPQLHLHHIIRHRADPAWPGPVWGAQRAIPYSDQALETIRGRLKPTLEKLTGSGQA